MPFRLHLLRGNIVWIQVLNLHLAGKLQIKSRNGNLYEGNKVYFCSLNAMVTIIKHITNYFLAALIVATTGGIGLLNHDCECNDSSIAIVSQESSDFLPCDVSDCCDQQDREESDHESGAIPAEKHSGTCCSDDSECCINEYLYFKTDQVNNPQTHKLSFRFHIAYEVTLTDAQNDQDAGIPVVRMLSDPSPPPGFGKTLLIKIHQLKNDPLIG